jgi:hypothetical protein
LGDAEEPGELAGQVDGEPAPSGRCQASGEATLSTISRSRTSHPSEGCENFLYVFKGACGASQAGLPTAPGAARHHPRGRSARHPAVTGWGEQASRRGGVGSVAAPYGRKPTGRGGCRAPLAAISPWPVARRLAGWHACRRVRPPPRARHPVTAQRSQARAPAVSLTRWRKRHPCFCLPRQEPWRLSRERAQIEVSSPGAIRATPHHDHSLLPD